MEKTITFVPIFEIIIIIIKKFFDCFIKGFFYEH